MSGQGLVEFDGIKRKIMGFIDCVVARTAFSFFLPFKLLSSPRKLEIFAVNLSVSLHKFGSLQWAIGNIFGFVT